MDHTLWTLGCKYSEECRKNGSPQPNLITSIEMLPTEARKLTTVSIYGFFWKIIVSTDPL